VVTVSADGAEQTLLAWVRAWLDLLAAGRLDDACALLDEPNSYGRRWTPADLVDIVDRAYPAGTRWRAEHPQGPLFTPVATARGRDRASVGIFDGGGGYWVEHDVPLNGEFSDLTARFEFRRRGGNEDLAAILHDMHVL
jgi:hypothetical protein